MIAGSIAILFALIVISGIVSAMEIALSAANRNKVKLLVDAGNKKAERLLHAIDEPSLYFATVQLYVTFIAFFSGAYAASAFTYSLVNLWSGLPLSERVIETIVFAVITVLLTFFALVFGELVPKRIAIQNPIPFALRILPLLRVLSVIALPFVKFLSFSAKMVLRLLRIKEIDRKEDGTEEEIRLMVETGSEQGHIQEDEQEMIENVFEFDKLTAGEVCTHRMDVVALPLDADLPAVLDVLTKENYSRIPVYEESLDNVLGILHSKDVMHYMAKQSSKVFNLKKLIREPHFVPDSKKTDELFQEMRKKRHYIAIVIDEYGGTLGIITMEDLVEEIVGNIQDEYDTDERPDIEEVDKNTFRIEGTADLEDVQEHLGVQLPVEEYETLSGFLIGELGNIPAEGEQPEVMFEQLTFKVENVQEKRISSVTVVKETEVLAENSNETNEKSAE